VPLDHRREPAVGAPAGSLCLGLLRFLLNLSTALAHVPVARGGSAGARALRVQRSGAVDSVLTNLPPRVGRIYLSEWRPAATSQRSLVKMGHSSDAGAAADSQDRK